MLVKEHTGGQLKKRELLQRSRQISHSTEQLNVLPQVNVSQVHINMI